MAQMDKDFFATSAWVIRKDLISEVSGSVGHPPRSTQLVVRHNRRFVEMTSSRSAAARSPMRAEQPVVGRWDPYRLEQVVTNLLTNVIKFGRGKPIEITIDSERQLARLSVIDHGIGIPADVQAHLFERFHRGVSLRHYGGLGLGLYIIRTIDYCISPFIHTL